MEMQAIKQVDASYGRATVFTCTWVYALPHTSFWDVCIMSIIAMSMVGLCRIEGYQILVACIKYFSTCNSNILYFHVFRSSIHFQPFNLNRCLLSLTYKNRCFSCSQVGQAAAQSLGCPWRRCPSRRQCSRAARTGSTAPGRFHVRCLSPGKTTSYSTFIREEA